MLEALRGIRAQEARHAIQMARIRACNMALFFAIMPVVSFITFAVVSRPFRVSATQRCACNMAMSFAIMPIVLFIVFAVISARLWYLSRKRILL